MFNHFAGIQVSVSPLAVQLVRHIERNPIPKRRKRYRVASRQEPGAMQIRDPFTGRVSFVVHPEVHKEMLAQSRGITA